MLLAYIKFCIDGFSIDFSIPVKGIIFRRFLSP
jgi:hypothetical protein